jgi:carboxypeptidase T
MKRTRFIGWALLGAAAVLGAFAASGARADDVWGVLFDGEAGPSTGSFKAFLARVKAEAPKPKPDAALGDRFWVVLRVSDKAGRTQASKLGLSIDSVESGAVGGTADAATLKRLRDAGLSVASIKPLGSFRPEDFPPQDGIFHNYGEVVSEMKSLAASGPGFVSAFSIGQSVKGRAIPGLKIGYPSGRPKAAAAFFGTHHAREHLSTEVPLLLARWLVENAKEPRVKKLLETRDVYIVPLVNPDGAEFDVETGNYKWHRKNLAKNADGSTGVDLNRNYDFRFGGEGASDSPGSDTYHGPSAFSEPESRAVRDFVNALPNLKMMVSYHTFSELILYPWGGVDEPIPDTRALNAFKAMAGKMAQQTGYTPQQSSDLYVATGDTCDWAWGSKGVFCFTFELTPKSSWQGGFYPGAGAVQSTFQKNIEPALYMIELADDPYRAATPNS